MNSYVRGLSLYFLSRAPTSSVNESVLTSFGKYFLKIAHTSPEISRYSSNEWIFLFIVFLPSHPVTKIIAYFQWFAGFLLPLLPFCYLKNVSTTRFIGYGNKVTTFFRSLMREKKLKFRFFGKVKSTRFKLLPVTCYHYICYITLVTEMDYHRQTAQNRHLRTPYLIERT